MSKMKVEYRDIDEVFPYHNNPRKNDELREKWVCGKCGRETTAKPSKNQVCGHDGCKGRYRRYARCECGEWFLSSGNDKKYCSKDCPSRLEKHGGSVTVACSYCGREIEKAASSVGKRQSFCDETCLRLYEASLRTVRTCKQCGKEFSILKSSLNSNASGNFCCRECYRLYQTTLVGSLNNHSTRIEVECPNCGKPFMALPSKIKANINVFCSNKCRHEYHHNYIEGEKNCNWKGGASRKRGNFEEVKRKHFSGTRFCAMCGTTKHVHIHHIIPYRLTQDNSPDNLIPLCRSHHKSVESRTLGFIESMDGKLDDAKAYLNIMLRGYQAATAAVVKQVMEAAR